MTQAQAELGRAMAGSGAVMLLRQIVGAALGLGTVLVVTACLGPAEYGRFAAVQVIIAVATALVPGGLCAALIRRPDEPDERTWSAATLLLVVAGVTVPLLLVGLAALAARCGLAHLAPEVMALACLGLLCAWPAQAIVARLERRLAYRQVAAYELAGQLVFACAACAAAWAGWGATALAAALSLQQVTGALCALAGAGGLPRPRWHAPSARALGGYAWGWATSAGAWQLRHLVNPLVVGWAAGASAVGHVALATRIVETLAAAKGVASRVGPAGLAKVRGDHEAMRRLVGQGMLVLVLAVGAVMSLAAVAAVFLAELLPTAWAGSLVVFPGLAIGAIAGSIAVLWTSVLLLEGRTGLVTVFHLAHAAVLATAALVLVPQHGVVGYAYAEIIAVSTFAISWWGCRQTIGPVGMGRVLACGALCAVVVSAPWARWFIGTVRLRADQFSAISGRLPLYSNPESPSSLLANPPGKA